ncbi:unnamed protein product (macronuclear) [Paramecium tetraurelia]|uniref:Protein kinase domain-containing protein n=1 Tax=Paramecium tetraurelia TaxID=5888 RepID=A0CHS3_PARTE|nr:uncharacterized protein GSPATT00038442001 [Paramecium tetraurelia]CAK70340.1 unnamed protein product [Paramecium tetraurelia]|eukprot:XP_001437737.1 hypothetical protein (macronuclear) [Paramecium tetraurelia strain d4-2]
MELGEQDLYTYLEQQQQNLTIESKIKIMIQITQFISYLHSKNLIHRDIKPENFIKVSDQFKLIDFGLTRKNQGRNTFVLIPEIVETSQNYTQAVDIWSLGCVYYEILTKSPLIEGKTESQVKNIIKNLKTDNRYLKQIRIIARIR